MKLSELNSLEDFEKSGLSVHYLLHEDVPEGLNERVTEIAQADDPKTVEHHDETLKMLDDLSLEIFVVSYNADLHSSLADAIDDAIDPLTNNGRMSGRVTRFGYHPEIGCYEIESSRIQDFDKYLDNVGDEGSDVSYPLAYFVVSNCINQIQQPALTSAAFIQRLSEISIKEPVNLPVTGEDSEEPVTYNGTIVEEIHGGGIVRVRLKENNTLVYVDRRIGKNNAVTSFPPDVKEDNPPLNIRVNVR